MALISLGKNAAMLERLSPPLSIPDGASAELLAVREDANDKIKKTKGDIQKSLTPWIPGDFLVTYGTLLAVWTVMQNNFRWLLVIAIGSAIAYVWLGAFSVTGFKDFSGPLVKKLVVRSIVGAILSILVAATVPLSGWYQLAWFKNNESAVIATLGIVTGLVVLLLTGLKMRGLIDTDAE